MAIFVTNSMTGKKEEFVPLEPGKVKMYVCGPTVYNFIHIGNSRVYIFYDVVARYLKYRGYQVKRAINFTDVDDKIINRAKEEQKKPIEVSETYVEKFREDCRSLGIQLPEAEPKATEHIPEMIALIERLIANGTAYVADDGEVLFSVRKFPEYGKLSKKNIDDLLAGARVETSAKKKDPMDFSLWKPKKVADEPSWPSPWCEGRPGWHIECSAMAMKHLGESFDLHGGGMDLMHPHHENEIAQAEAATKKPFVKYWMHSNMLQFDSVKMSKSLGNIILARDFIKKYSGETLKFLILSGHYRSVIDFSDKHIKDCLSGLHRIYSSLLKAKNAVAQKAGGAGAETPEEKALKEFSDKFVGLWTEAMDDDFNTAKAMGYIFEYVRAVNAVLDKKGFKLNDRVVGVLQTFLNQMAELSAVFNLFGEKPEAFLKTLRNLILVQRGLTEAFIQDEIQKRTAARAAKNFAESDRIRNDLNAKGIELRDKGTETEWDVF